MLLHSYLVPEELRAKLDETDCFKAIRADERALATPAPDRNWTIEYARADGATLEAWLFLKKAPGQDDSVIEHIHLTVYPDGSETTITVRFLQSGPGRVVVKHSPRERNSPS